MSHKDAPCKRHLISTDTLKTCNKLNPLHSDQMHISNSNMGDEIIQLPLHHTGKKVKHLEN